MVRALRIDVASGVYRAMAALSFLAAGALVSFAAGAPAPPMKIAPFTVDASFPGGNILVEKIEGDTVCLKPELKGTARRWFYWYFRVTGAGGRTLTFAAAPGALA